MIRCLRLVSLLAIACLAPVFAIGLADNQAFARNCCKPPKCKFWSELVLPRQGASAESPGAKI